MKRTKVMKLTRKSKGIKIGAIKKIARKENWK